jgi:hypothetical protein
MTGRIHNVDAYIGPETVVDQLLGELRPDERRLPGGDVAQPYELPREKRTLRPLSSFEERRAGSAAERADHPELPTHRPDFTRPRGRR